MNSEIKICQNCKQNFVIEPEDFEFYAKIKVPAPTFCPECRLQRRLYFYNVNSIYKRKCDFTGEDLISIFHQDSPVKVYKNKIWWSDQWDALNFGNEVDFSKSFFEQLSGLIKRVPHMALSVSEPTMINSQYTNAAGALKNCYLVFFADYCENVSYSHYLAYVKDSIDVLWSNGSENSYEGINITKCYKTFFSQDCENCYNIYFSKNLIGCNDCFMCSGLRNKSCCILNEQYTKEEYERKLKEFETGGYKFIEDSKIKAQDFHNKYPKKFIHGKNNFKSTGDYIYQSKNAKEMYTVTGVEDSKWCEIITLEKTKDAYDYSGWGNNAQLVYECSGSGEGINNLKFSHSCWPNDKNLEYCQWSRSCSDCFGCVGLNNKQYCILNKQYTKEEYEQLVPRIIEHMNNMPYIDKKGRVYKYGEFFPPELSPFSYNETIAQEYFPLTKEQAEQQGYSWKDPEERNIQPTITSDQLPDHIKDVSDTITKEIIQCAHKGQCNEQCTEAFKIIPQELEFYRKMNLPLPRLCPNCRHYQRLKQRNPLKLWYRQCMCNGKESGSMNNELGIKYQNTIIHSHGTEPCPNEFETTYSPDRKEIVYCEKCYNSEVA